MSRERAIASVFDEFDSGRFAAVMDRRIAIPTESQNPDRAADLKRYLDEEMIPAFTAMGFTTRVLEHPKALAPFL